MHSLIIYNQKHVEELNLDILQIIDIILTLKEKKEENIKFEVKIDIENIELEEYKLLMKLILNGKKNDIIDNFENKYELDEWIYVWSVLSYCIKKSI